MEHLPDVENPAYDIPTIPYLGNIVAYDGRGFHEFPERQGWTVHNSIALRDIGRNIQEGPRNTNPALQTPEILAAFVQAWLYFGVLDEVFNVILGLNVSLEDFKDVRDGQMFLTTSQLRRHLEDWQDKQGIIDADHYSGKQLMEESHFPKLHSELRQVLNEVRDFFAKFRIRDDVTWARCITVELQMAIFILADTLKAAGLYVWREWQPGMGQNSVALVGFQGSRKIQQDKFGIPSAKVKAETPGLQQVWLSPFRDLFGKKLAELGWCPSEYRMLSRLLFEDTTGLFIASRINRTFSSTEQSHASCTTERCVASEIELGTYQGKHASECANSAVCRIIEVDSDFAAQQIAQDRLPLVSISWAPFQEWDNEYRRNTAKKPVEHYAPIELRCEETENYIAISHVWSQGLGNPTCNALPECQLRRLKRIAELVRLRVGLTEEPAIWIDTLCIPVSQEHRDIRKKAIGTISQIFRKAKQVVVLDADLQQTSTSVNRTELSTRILLCGWMRRLWTLNEAVISGDTPDCQRLLVMFAEGPQPYNSVFQKDVSSLYNSEAAVKSLIMCLPQRFEVMHVFKDLTRALEYRSTSWQEDEPICLAGILGLDVRKVIEGKTAPERMSIWYSMLASVPLELIFHDTETLDIPGKRWAPRSFLSHNRSGPHILEFLSDRLATIHAQGVMINDITAYFIHSTQPVTTSRDRWCDHEDLEPPERTLFLRPPAHKTTNVWYKALEVKLLTISRPAILKSPFQDDAILVSVIGDEAGVVYCESVLKLKFSTDVPDFNKDVIFYAGEASSNLSWCLG